MSSWEKRKSITGRSLSSVLYDRDSLLRPIISTKIDPYYHSNLKLKYDTFITDRTHGWNFDLDRDTELAIIAFGKIK